MKSVYFLIIICCAFVLFRVFWITYDYTLTKETGLPKQCECTCVDTKTYSKDLQTSIQYVGVRTTDTCDCQDFLMPKIKSLADPRHIKALCDVCQCDYMEKTDLIVTMTFTDIFDIITVTIVCITLVLLVYRCLFILQGGLLAQTPEDRRHERVDRAFRVLEDICRENFKKAKARAKELLTKSELVKVNIHECPDEVCKNYKTFFTEI